MDNFKTPGKKNVQEDDEDDINDSEEKRPYYCTPKYWDSFKGDKEDPIKVPEVSDEKSITSLGTDEITSRGSVDCIGEDEVQKEGVGKRKWRLSNLVKSPYIPVIPTKHAKRSAKANEFNHIVFELNLLLIIDLLTYYRHVLQNYTRKKSFKMNTM